MQANKIATLPEFSSILIREPILLQIQKSANKNLRRVLKDGFSLAILRSPSATNASSV